MIGHCPMQWPARLVIMVDAYSRQKHPASYDRALKSWIETFARQDRGAG